MSLINSSENPYLCPICSEKIAFSATVAQCAQGHEFEISNNGAYIKFCDTAMNESDYSVAQAAEIHDRSLEWLLAVNDITEKSFRQELLSPLKLKPGM